MTREILLLSTSTVYGGTFLDYCLDEVNEHFEGTDEILFVPYARPGGISFDDYTGLVSKKFREMNKKVTGAHEVENLTGKLNHFGGVYIGGGNTFLLLKTLYDLNLMEGLRHVVLKEKMKYMGSSAGSNVACKTISNTNDMPIVYPPSFDALSLVPFNINPHYLDIDPTSRHQGESRETRIREFHFQFKIPVVGLREGSWLKITDDKISLCGNLQARLFMPGSAPAEKSPSDDLSFLLR